MSRVTKLEKINRAKRRAKRRTRTYWRNKILATFDEHMRVVYGARPWQIKVLHMLGKTTYARRA